MMLHLVFHQVGVWYEVELTCNGLFRWFFISLSSSHPNISSSKWHTLLCLRARWPSLPNVMCPSWPMHTPCVEGMWNYNVQQSKLRLYHRLLIFSTMRWGHVLTSLSKESPSQYAEIKRTPRLVPKWFSCWWRSEEGSVPEEQWVPVESAQFSALMKFSC